MSLTGAETAPWDGQMVDALLPWNLTNTLSLESTLLAISQVCRGLKKGSYHMSFSASSLLLTLFSWLLEFCYSRIQQFLIKRILLFIISDDILICFYLCCDWPIIVSIYNNGATSTAVVFKVQFEWVWLRLCVGLDGWQLRETSDRWWTHNSQASPVPLFKPVYNWLLWQQPQLKLT